MIKTRPFQPGSPIDQYPPERYARGFYRWFKAMETEGTPHDMLMLSKAVAQFFTNDIHPTMRMGVNQN